MSDAGILEEVRKPNPIAQYVAEVELYDKEAAEWEKRRKKIVKRFKDERGDTKDGDSRYNILWSMIQTQLPMLGARNPKPDIQRRFKDADPVGRVASDVLERCVTYFADTDKFYAAWRAGAVFDYALVGRGSLWVRYNPTIVKEAIEVTDEAVAGEGGDNDKPQFTEKLAYEDIEVDHVHCGDLGYNACRSWDEVWLIWRIVYMTRAEMVERFKDKGKLPPLDYKAKNSKKQTLDDGIGKAVIYEAWDKSKKKAVWFHKTIPEFLDEREDPLKLKDFFPCPKPLFTNLANDGLIPTPDYIEYQDQAIELDNLTGRIQSITKSLKVAGVYAGDAASGVVRLFTEGTENQLIPVEQWAMFAEKGGLKGVFELIPLDMIANALTALYAARDKVKGDLYEITGMADIVRGNSDAQETATAQSIKSNFATMRLSDRQREVQRFVRETIRIMVDMLAGHFQLDTIKTISGVRLLTNDEKVQYAAYKAAPAAPSGGQPSPPPMGHNGGPPMGVGGMPPQQGQPVMMPGMMPQAPGAVPLPGVRPPFTGQPMGQQQPAPMQGQPSMMAGAQAPHPMMTQPGQVGPMPPAPMGMGAGLPLPGPPPLPPGTTLDQMQTMLTDPSWEEVYALIKNEPLRCFRIDIETDSTIKADEQQDKADRVEFLKAAGGFLQQAESIGEAQPALLPLMGQMLMFGIRGFQIGKELEGSFNTAIAQMEKQAANPQQKPDPAMAKVQAAKELEQQSAGNKLQLEIQQTKDDAATAQAKAQAQAAVDQHQNQLEYQRHMEELASTERLEKYKTDSAARTAIAIARINNAGKITAAQVAAGVGDGAEETARDDAGEGGDGPHDPTLIPLQIPPEMAAQAAPQGAVPPQQQGA